MHCLAQYLLCAAALAGSAVAGHTHTQCFTAVGPSSAARVRTVTTTSTQPCTSPKTVTVTVTTSTKGGTETVIYESTTHAQATTVTVTPSGFLPIDKTAKGVSYDGSAGSDSSAKSAKRLAHRKAFAVPGASAKQFATAVSCNEVVAATQCTTTATATTTITTGAATTISTSTIVTYYSSTVTVNAQCESNNFANSYDKMKIDDISESTVLTDVGGQAFTNSTSALNCCNAIVSAVPKGAVWIYFQNATYAAEVGGNCGAFFFTDACPNGQNSQNFTLSTNPTEFGQIVVGNLACGKVTSAATTPATATATASS